MPTITFQQPTHPLSINEANRLHWAAKRRRLEPWKVSLLVELRALPKKASPEDPHPIVVTVTLTFPRAARRDPHNYTGTVVKALVDTLTVAGTIPDDTADWVTVADPIIRVAKDNLCVVSIERRTK